MSFSIVLGKTNNDNRVVDKNIYGTKSFNCNTREETDILNPVITIQTKTNLSNFNYARISQWHRYYFIQDIKIARDGLWELSLKVDVLKTYASAIKNMEGIVERQQNDYNLDITDNERIVTNDTTEEIIRFKDDSGDDTYLCREGLQSFVLVTAGHEVSSSEE